MSQTKLFMLKDETRKSFVTDKVKILCGRSIKKVKGRTFYLQSWMCQGCWWCRLVRSVRVFVPVPASPRSTRTAWGTCAARRRACRPWSRRNWGTLPPPPCWSHSWWQGERRNITIRHKIYIVKELVTNIVNWWRKLIKIHNYY